MEYVVPLVIMLVVVLVVVVGARLLGRRNQSAQDQGQDRLPGSEPAAPRGKAGTRSKRGREITREDAEEASARLSPEAHRRVYSLIAQHQVFDAVREFRKATKSGLGDAAASVAALAQFPQPAPQPPATGQAGQPAEKPDLPEVTVVKGTLTVEDIINAGPAAADPMTEPAASTPETSENSVTQAPDRKSTEQAATQSRYRYRAIVSQGDEVREVASTRLNAEIYAQIRQLALSGNHDGAARLLCDHADIGPADAQEFVSMIGPED